MLGASNKFTAEEQLDQIALYWINLNEGAAARADGAHRELPTAMCRSILDGGNRIPRAAERQARSVAELRAAGIGVRKVLMIHDGTLASHDVFEWLLTMLLPEVELDFVKVASGGEHFADGHETIDRDTHQAEQLGRKVNVLSDRLLNGPEIVQFAQEGGYNLMIVPRHEESTAFGEQAENDWADYVMRHSPCSVFLASHPTLPKEVVV